MHSRNTLKIIIHTLVRYVVNKRNAESIHIFLFQSEKTSNSKKFQLDFIFSLEFEKEDQIGWRLLFLCYIYSHGIFLPPRIAEFYQKVLSFCGQRVDYE